jgi:hypothetical protein
LAKGFDPGQIQGRGGRDQNSYPENPRRLLRLDRNPAEGECDNDGDNPQPFSILDGSTESILSTAEGLITD